jgi:CRISPR system Cascade subunit CasD
MRRFLILKLQGPMQAWGDHTFEGIRPSANIPTKSAIIGLLSACLGIKRNDRKSLKALVDGIQMAVRADQQEVMVQKITDYHTILDARIDYTGLKSHPNSIQTWREYLCDASFTVAIWEAKDCEITIDCISDALNRPYFTPYLGRRSCPIARPLFEKIVEADNFKKALDTILPAIGVIYSDEDIGNGRTEIFRDLPLTDRPRQFGNRMVYSYPGGDYVSE